MKSQNRKTITKKRRPKNSAVDLFAEAGLLKRVKRSGWWVVGIKDPESVADHSFRCAVIAYYIAHKEGSDPYRTMTMALFNDIHEEINTDNLRFPLHDGVKMYLDRAKPSFLQKYAEVMALIITITVLLFGGLTSLSNWQKQRKKDRIDVYYQKVINLDPAINDAKSSHQLHNIETQLFFIRDEAFDLLIKEKLSADESFNIFLRVLETSISRIHKKIDILS